MDSRLAWQNPTQGDNRREVSVLLSINISEKSFGDKLLYDNLQFEVQPGEKVGLIGRNGTGKSTLFNMITGDDTDYQGSIETPSNAVVIASRQEHHGFETNTVLEYIQGDLPEFTDLHHIIETYPVHMGESHQKLQRYSEALERFSQLGYFEIENQLTQALETYQLSGDKLYVRLDQLSGGQRRMVELIKVQRAHGDIALIDEPTNHMDYVAKQAFVQWLKSTQEAVLVITHDRDVLQQVDKIIELRDGRAYSCKGNYEQYLKTNRNQVTSEVNEYDLSQRRIVNLKSDLIRFQRMKEKARDPGTIKRFKGLEQKTASELAVLKTAEKPSFWIDRASSNDLSPKLTGAYEKYKARNIQLDTSSTASKTSRLLVEAFNFSLGYGDKPLFDPIAFELREGERVRLHGRNGAGKTTLVNTILAKAADAKPTAKVFSGTIALEAELPIGVYEQEIDTKYLHMTLAEAVEHACREKDLPHGEQQVKQLLGNYLFDPIGDGRTLVSRLSGGQKARLQLIRMLLGNPLLLILDEPTNHLDLPSIEELEDALGRYNGAVLYISHDSYFANNLGGTTVTVGQN